MNSKEGNNNTAKKGRKTKYTPKIVERICELVAKDTYSVPDFAAPLALTKRPSTVGRMIKASFAKH